MAELLQQQADFMMVGDGVYFVQALSPEYRFITIINNSDNKIEVYQDRITFSDSNLRDTLVVVPNYTQITVPIGSGRDFTFIYRNGGAAGEKKVNVIFSNINLNVNGTLGNPASAGNVTLIGDGIGLAKSSQLPAALAGDGGLKVSIQGSTNLKVTNSSGGDTLTVDGTVQLKAGSAAVGTVGVTSLPATPAGTNAIGDVGVQYRTNSTGAASIKHIVAAATTNATIVKAGAGRVVGYAFTNLTAAAKFVKLHNIATTPTAGSGVVMTIALPPNWRAELEIPGGIGFSTGIGLTITNAYADADTTAVAAGDVVGDVFYA